MLRNCRFRVGQQGFARFRHSERYPSSVGQRGTPLQVAAFFKSVDQRHRRCSIHVQSATQIGLRNTLSSSD
jgi:hypothetical protein